jgi:transaldolase/glucose-6-phosphate isomerase
MQTMSPRTLATADLCQAGQSPWLDFISRDMIQSGKMKSLIQDSGVLGVTSNPSIFEKAMGQGTAYDTDIQKGVRKGLGILDIYDGLAISDIQKTCDLFLPVFKKTSGEHGFVSLEVTPDLAYDYETTVSEAKRLFKAVARPNVMIKIPATPEGVRAVRAVIGSGVSVNVTLMFSMKHYQDVAQAYLDGLADYKKTGGDISRVYSVASVFVSRIDTLLDKKLEGMGLKDLQGKAAVANSKLIYQEYKKIFGSDKAKKLQAAGGKVQKVLWGSTSVKNPAYSDLIYVENLVGEQTVNTLPMNTLEALLDHGIIRRNSIEEGVDEARAVVAQLKSKGIDLLEVGEALQKDGVKSFCDSFDSLMKTLELKRESYSKNAALKSTQQFFVPGNWQQKINQSCQKLQQQDFLNRFLKGDAKLWKEDPAHQASINNRLGWLKAHEWITGKLYEIDLLVAQARQEKIKDIVLLGMGGSSLAPEVMSLICGVRAGVRFHVLDTTDPVSVLAVKSKIVLKKALFIVASKSGGTIETMSQFQYFYALVQKSCGKKPQAAGRHFIAITDAGSSLQQLAKEKFFRKTFINPSNIGGRYSALSFFGMVPAALLGINIRAIIQSARAFSAEFEKIVSLEANPAVSMGVLMAEFAKAGVDKMTFLASSDLAPFGTWLEQLIAESVGKEGKGVIFVEGEEPAAASAYGKDRLFISMKLKEKSSPSQIGALRKAGFPVAVVEWGSPETIGAEFLKWEIATAVAGVLMGINPFDEPNVKEAKDYTAKLLEVLKEKGKLENPKSFAAAKSADLGSFLKRKKTGAYLAFLAYTERTPQMNKAFNRIRRRLQEAYKMPVLLGFGPRYLHSIGQLYKGGTPSGLFVTFVKQEKQDPKIPGAFYTFGQLKKAQAFGDVQAIESHGLPAMVVDLGKDALAGLRAFEKQADAGIRRLCS